MKITSIDEGRARVAEIGQEISQLLLVMQKTDGIPEWQKLSAKKYDLIKERREIQGQMAKLARVGSKR